MDLGLLKAFEMGPGAFYIIPKLLTRGLNLNILRGA